MINPGQIPLEEFASGIVARTCRGPGESILWIHGYTIDSSSWAEIWSHLPGWTHIGVDLPGHGGSAAVRPMASLQELGETLAEAALRQGVRHVVGLSLGSLFALEVVLARPDAFATLTMAAPALARGPVEASVGTRFMDCKKCIDSEAEGRG